MFSWKNTTIKIPLCGVLISNPNSWSHLRTVLTDTERGYPSSRVEFGNKVLFTHLQKLAHVMFGWRGINTNILPGLLIKFSSSLFQRTPFHWYLLCLLSGRIPLLFSPANLHKSLRKSQLVIGEKLSCNWSSWDCRSSRGALDISGWSTGVDWLSDGVWGWTSRVETRVGGSSVISWWLPREA